MIRALLPRPRCSGVMMTVGGRSILGFHAVYLVFIDYYVARGEEDTLSGRRLSSEQHGGMGEVMYCVCVG